MTDTDKTRQKLVNSMRKSKDTSGNKSAPKVSPPKKAAVTKKTTKQSKPAGGAPSSAPARDTAPAKPRPAPVKPSQVTAVPYEAIRRVSDDSYQHSSQVTADSYQSGRRVWPD